MTCAHSKESPQPNNSLSNQKQSQEHPISDSDSESEDDLQAFMDEGKEQDMSTLSDLEDFFQPDEGTGSENH